MRTDVTEDNSLFSQFCERVWKWSVLLTVGVSVTKKVLHFRRVVHGAQKTFVFLRVVLHTEQDRTEQNNTTATDLG